MDSQVMALVTYPQLSQIVDYAVRDMTNPNHMNVKKPHQGQAPPLRGNHK